MRWRVLAPCLVAVALVGCGAKTGLYVPDGGENAPFDAGVDGADAADAGPDAPCIEIPFDGGPVEIDLEIEAEVGAADVVFLIDTTASMMDEIVRIRETIRDRLAPEITRAIPDSQIGVATFADFPVMPYGASRDRPFVLRQPVTRDLALVQAAVNAITLDDGRDLPESQVEALFQLATGSGRGTYVAPSAGCPRGGVGYACVRADALPLALLFTDAEFHNGPPPPPGGAYPYGSEVRPAPATYPETVRALNNIGMRVIGFDSDASGTPRRHLERIAVDTGAIIEDRGRSRPLYFSVGSRGERLDTSVVEAIRTLASNFVQDVDAVLFDGDANDGVNALDLVESFLPSRADPPDGIDGIDGDVFRGARAGTRLYWVITVRNDAVVPGPEPRRVRLEVLFRGDGTRRLGRRFVDLIIPGADGAGCEAL